MRIELLDEAETDLIDGLAFYERQSKGLGEYFLDSVFADIESLRLYAGIHGTSYGQALRNPKASRSVVSAE